MGNCAGSLSQEELELKRKSEEINNAMNREAKKDGEKVKLLLLGAGESGKSTIFKQMKVIYGKTFTVDELRMNIPTIYTNIIQSMKILVEQTAIFGLVSSVVATDAFAMVKGFNDNQLINMEVGNALTDLWKDPGIQLTWERRSEFQIVESVRYYFDRLHIIKQPGYIPDKNDVLYCRVRTSGIVTETYEIDGTTFEMYDVGGQRNERKKWIHCFESVTAVIFVAALSEYDQVLFEDMNSNRMTEALDLFADIINNPFFAKSSIILFLNKRDLFEDKIKRVPIRNSPAFADYEGPDDSYDKGVQYFLNKFLARNKNPLGHQVYSHTTCATDTHNVTVVFDSCKDIILRANLKDSGFMD